MAVIVRYLFVVTWVFLGIFSMRASSVVFSTREQQAARADAIFRGTVLQDTGFRSSVDGGIYTRTILRVDEALKGTFPQTIQLIHPGGELGEMEERNGFSPRFRNGEERLLFLQQRPNGSFFSMEGEPTAVLLHRTKGTLLPEEDALLEMIRHLFPNAVNVGIDTRGQSGSVPSPTVVGGLTGTGIPRRFVGPDRGEKISYLVDAEALPAGISLPQALGAVSNAFRAWSQATYVQFVFEGTTNFGQAASLLTTNDSKIRVQLHDLYDVIPPGSVLGIGGASAQSGIFSSGGLGGKVGTNEFYLNTCGYLVLAHTNTALQNLTTLEEVLCHEIGHIMSLDHSSENPNEPDSNLKQATMYYASHSDGRGAITKNYDTNMIQRVYPLGNPLPYSCDRILDVVTHFAGAPNVAGINEVELRGYSVGTNSLTLAVTGLSSNNGTFSLSGKILKYAPKGYFNGTRLDPSSGSSFDTAYVRFTDGTNASPYKAIRVISLMPDSSPNDGSDGIPDSWMTQYFGDVNPSTGSKHTAGADFDGDGISNLDEFRAGTIPTNPSSALKVATFSTTNLQFIAKPYDVYELQVSTNLTNWARTVNPIVPVVTNAVITNFVTPSSTKQFFRIQRVP